MNASEITRLRTALGLTQAQLATLLGVHALTLSKWERGVLAPSPYQAALMQSFAQSQQQEPDVGAIVGGVLLAAGVGAALFLLLKPAFEDAQGQRPKRKARKRPALRRRKP